MERQDIRKIHMAFGRMSVSALLLRATLLASACLSQIAPLRADDALECRKGYVSDFCIGTMLVVFEQAKNAGKTELIFQLMKQHQEFSVAYKSTVVFDESTKKLIYKDAFDRYSSKTVGGCIGKDKEGTQSLVEAAVQFCEKR